MIVKFNATRSVVANRVTTGDKHDVSIERFMQEHPTSHILIVPRGDRFEVMAGNIMPDEPMKIPITGGVMSIGEDGEITVKEPKEKEDARNVEETPRGRSSKPTKPARQRTKKSR